MVDWAYVNGFGEEGGDPDLENHDPEAHCCVALPYRSVVYGPALRCKHCGSQDVYWQRTRAGYRLYSIASHEQHQCPKPDPTAGFKDLTK